MNGVVRRRIGAVGVLEDSISTTQTLLTLDDIPLVEIESQSVNTIMLEFDCLLPI